ncbi:UDP-4-amino-4,6-dideoxy-N-acetyl-beta-L-altrosamine N-acetyltransferase [Luteithermobacter gelatinilyticus]|uniref:UDP-4-amino-4, 6-dideoxy-N-acetyl-beta-L-altrosamine N-acetyltransferase n=1 Tax=Luteithermobacter gelatinilyticus TaxID=2582913 RepID=UPI0011058B9B|nr:UDP-4-amino-4,6-dideoxy-N-acetyl-beta-L-altrosamine N-acetyltransferase [Luteithermobacter gelatinilyticus]
MALNLNYADYVLRPVEESDKERILDWRNRDHVRRHMYTNHIISTKEHERWFAGMMAAPDKEYHIFLYQGRPMGVVGFYDIQVTHRRADWAFYLGESDAPKGCGPVMEFLALNHAFDRLRLNKLCCEVLTSNVGVIRLHERFGFIQEGLRKEHYVIDGEPRDMVELALFEAVWREERDRHQRNLFAGG